MNAEPRIADRPPKASKTMARAKLWPHGDFSAWRQRTTAVNPGVKRYQEVTKEDGYTGPSLMGSSTIAISEHSDQACTKPRNWALNSNMKKLLRSAGTLMERKHGRQRMAFVTVTMPGLSDSGVKRFLIEWPNMVMDLNALIRMKCKRAGLDYENAWVTELQGKRGARVGYPCPHLHALINAKSESGKWVIDKDWLNKTWNDIVFRYIKEPFDGRASTRIEGIRKSVTAYMTKYVCKQSIYDARCWEGTEWEPFLPKRWGYVSKNLSKEVKQSIDRLMGEGAYYFQMDLSQLSDEGQVAIVFNEYGCQAGFVMKPETFNLAWEYYRTLDQKDLFGNDVQYMPG